MRSTAILSILLSSLLMMMVCQTEALGVNRRNVFAGIAGTAATAFAVASSPEPVDAKDVQGAEAFVGTYSDPINHPGGKRTIRLLDTKVGDYQLAEVLGGGGVGEPKNYILPAAVIGDRTIVIDFSPKGGPKDFVGVLDKSNGDIKFLRDGNRWPRVNE